MLATLGCGAGGGEPEQPSILLVVVDTLRADALGAYGADRTEDGLTTTAMDRLAEEGVAFDAAYAAAPWTLPSMATILTGLPTVEHGARRVGKQDIRGLRAGVPTVAEALADAGYRTGAVVTNPYLAPSFGLGRGFEDYLHLTAPGRRAKVRGDAIADAALEWLADGDGEPSFLWVHLFDPHMSYDPPGDLRPDWLAAEADPDGTLRALMRRLWIKEQVANLPGETRAQVRDLYDREVVFADRQLARLLDAVESDARPWLVILTSDHGEEFWDHGGFEHGHTVYDELVRVPLVVRWPDAQSGRVDAIVRHSDVAPTILAAAGVEPAVPLAGRDLADGAALAGDPPPVVIANTLYGVQQSALIAGDLKLVRTVGEAPRLFDLASDPAEQHDIAGEHGALVDELLRELERQLAREVDEGAAVEMTEDLRRELEALGYLR